MFAVVLRYSTNPLDSCQARGYNIRMSRPKITWVDRHQLREALRRHYITAKDMARSLGVSDSAAYSWASGHSAVPHARALQMAELYGVDVSPRVHAEPNKPTTSPDVQ